MENEIVVTCPHCRELVLISELNCKIFRHGVYISNGEQVNPHAPKNICDEIFQQKIIYGCGKPFQIEIMNHNYIAVICDYI